MEKAWNPNSEGDEFQSDKNASVAWKIKISNEDLNCLRHIAEEMGKDRLIPKPTVTALLHKAIHTYIEAWGENLPANSGSRARRLRTVSALHA